jgi:hypothetical protein
VLAREKGFVVFSLQFYFECFMGAVADVARMLAVSQKTTDEEC